MPHRSQQRHHDDRAPYEPHDLGLAHDLPVLLSRRRVFGVLGGAAGLAALAACGDAATTAVPAGTPSAASVATTAATAAAAGSDDEIPEETAGPYPADGSNGVNVLTESGIVRSDISGSFGSASGVAEGVRLTITLTVLDVGAGGGGALAAAAVYLWHCDRDGNYSMYSQGVEAENYLRGVQETDAQGRVTFTSIFPGAYSGRWPHAHFEVYPSLQAATSASGKLRTSQLALPQDVCETVYATPGYERSVQNLAATSLDTDNVFSDGYSLQLAAVTGSVAAGYTATLNVPV